MAATLLVISVVKRVTAPLPEAAFSGTSLVAVAAAAVSARVYGTDGGKATAALPTLGPTEIQRYDARADTVLARYEAGGSSR